MIRIFYSYRQKNGKRFVYKRIPGEIRRDCPLTSKIAVKQSKIIIIRKKINFFSCEQYNFISVRFQITLNRKLFQNLNLTIKMRDCSF